jgi:glycosyltransferase involved in cell wall biosynthesis
MKILVVHNEYGRFSGEEAVVDAQCRLLVDRGHQVERFTRGSDEIPKMWLGETRAFFSGIYSHESARQMQRRLQTNRPDIVHVHNVYPLISPSVLGVCRQAGVPVAMTVHNYRLVCPNGLHLSHGAVCERCSGGREYWCVLRNCEGNLCKSIGYAARNYVARSLGLFIDNVGIFMVLTEFNRRRLIAAGYSENRIVVLPNMVFGSVDGGRDSFGDYVGYAGRISPEKGTALLVEGARRSPAIPFQAAGSYDRMPDQVARAPSNFQFRGHLDGMVLDEFFDRSRIIVLSSICFEGFPVTLAQAMLHGKPVVAPRIGGIPEIVDEGVTGLLFEPGNAREFADRVRYLWENPELCRRMGQAGRKKALHEYSVDRYYDRLMAAYEKAVANGSSTDSAR